MNFVSRKFPLSILGFMLLSTASLAQVAYRWVGADGSVHYSDQTPPDDAVKKEQRDLRDWNNISGAGKSFEQERAERLYPITLYTIAECKVECSKAKNYLDLHKIAYEEKNIVSPEDANAYTNATKLSQVVAPVLKIGENVYRGFDESAWQKQLEFTGHLAKAPEAASASQRAQPAQPPVSLTPRPAAEGAPPTSPDATPSGTLNTNNNNQ